MLGILLTLELWPAYRGGNGMESAEQQTAVEDLLQHAGWLRNLAGTLVGESSADDLVQEAYLSALRSPPDPDRPARPWLAKVARNAARMRFRGESRRAEREAATVDLLGKPDSPADSAERLELQRMLCELVLALPEPYRATVVGLYFDGLQAVELAKRDGLKPATVRQRHKHALGLLRDMLDQKSGGDRPSWLAALIPIANPQSIVDRTIGSASAVKGMATMKLLKALVILLVLSGSTATAIWAAWAAWAPDRVAKPAVSALDQSRPRRESSGEPTTTATRENRSRRSRRQSLLAALRKAHPAAANPPLAQRARGKLRGGDDDIEEILGGYAPYLRRRIDEFRPLLRECYEISRTRRLTSTLVLEFAIIGDEDLGALVEEAHIVDGESSFMPNDELRECVTETLYALEIEPPPGGGRLVYKAPFTFGDVEFGADAQAPRSAKGHQQSFPTSGGPHGSGAKDSSAAKGQERRTGPEKPETQKALKCDEVLCLVHPEREPACCRDLERRRKRAR